MSTADIFESSTFFQMYMLNSKKTNIFPEFVVLYKKFIKDIELTANGM